MKEDEDEDEEEEDEDEEDTGDEDEDADEDEDSDQGDEETSCGAPGEQKGVGDGKSAADVLIVGEEKAQHHKEDGTMLQLQQKPKPQPLVVISGVFLKNLLHNHSVNIK